MGGGSALPNHDPEKRHDQLLVAQLEHMRAEFNEYMSRLDKINKRAKKLHKDLK
jgi:tetrahydromethanopterin S-methyltransferase subunit G